MIDLWIKDREKILSGSGDQINFHLQELTSPEALRMAEQLKAQYAFYSGDVAKARDILIKALAEYGDNIECLKDLACCHYQLGEMNHWRKCYSRLLNDLHRLENRLSVRTQTECWICVAKFMEEEGHMAEALKVYRKYYYYLEQDRENPQFVRVLSQLVRLESLFDSEKDLGQLYSELLRLKGADLVQDFNTEVQHALMLAELALVGPDHAWIRVNTILNSQETLRLDKSLMLFDFIETCILQEIPLSSLVQKALAGFEGEDLFEQELRRLVQKPETVTLEELSGLASELSWAGYLRLLILWIRVAPQGIDIQELKNKINLILSSFKPESKGFWMNRIRFAMGQPETRLVFDPQSRLLSCQNQSVDLSKKKGMQTLLCKLAEKPQQSIDDMIRALWESDFSPEHYHRLRMTVHRLNGLIGEITSIVKAIEVSSERVALRHEIKLFLSSQIVTETSLADCSF